MKKTILITTATFDAGGSGLLEQLRAVSERIITNPFGKKLTEAQITALITEHKPVGIIAGVEPITADVLNAADGLLVISRCGAGTDSVDLSAAQRRGIVVVAAPDAVTIPVAELTVGLILGALRQIHRADASIRNSGWERPMGMLLCGKTVGIVGLGRIGTYLSRILSAFGCRLVGHDPALKSHEVCELTDLEELLARSDIVTLHLPYSEGNRHLINQARIRWMKNGALLVNAARGGLVDEEALYDILVSGRLSGAALDCFEEEPYVGRLATLPNVLLTTHIGSYAREARAMMERQAVENLLAELTKKGVLS